MPRDAEALLHAQRVAPGLVGAALVQAHQVEHLVDAALGDGSTRRREDAQVVAPREVVVERGRLHQGAHFEEASALAPRIGLAQQLDLAGIGTDEPHQQAHQGGLARTVGSEEPVDHAARDREVQSLQGGTCAVTLHQPARAQGERVTARGRCGHAGVSDSLRPSLVTPSHSPGSSRSARRGGGTS